ncbi:MAG: FtsW/RodA/SpoVE family cell cycle protein [Lentisphaeria bacterium]|nr:FtsW/RodA/SpoVE family cell cycle protein [Lentisphaeria bacterium]NLZ60375.1 FtsW/RodA/SpoVE family cell cycle protein [Lentisphaerota bacterium]
MNTAIRDKFSFSQLLFWFALLALALFGLFYIYSSGYIGDDYPVRANWQRQIVFLLLGAALFQLFSNWDNQSASWRYFVWLAYAGSLLGLVAVLFFGKEIGGARRWLQLGPLMLQPAEPAKIFTLLLLCQLMQPGQRGAGWRQAGLVCAVLLLPMLLIRLEPSLGNALMLLPPFLALICVNHCHSRLFAPLLTLALLVASLAVGALFWLRAQAPEKTSPFRQMLAQQEESGKTGLLRPYHLRRLDSYVSSQGGWNERQSIMCVASGGLSGKGFRNGTLKSLGYLPRTVAPTDFIFSVIAEEGGFLYGSLPILLLYALLVSVCLYWAANANSRLHANICLAFATLIQAHVLISIGMSIRLLPIVGLPLPLLSYGGSFTLCFLMAMGNVAATRSSKNAPDKKIQVKLGRIFMLSLENTARENPQSPDPLQT